MIILIRIAICDDEQLCLDKTAEYLTKWQTETETMVDITLFTGGDNFLETSRHIHFDIAFLDILMPLLNGMDTAKELRQFNKSIPIVFLTSSKEFALEGYSVKASDYLLKPITYDKIKRVMDELVIELSKETPAILLKTTSGYHKVYLHQIEYLEASNKKVRVFLQSGTELEALETFSHFQELLTLENGFFKCHRSYLVNIFNVDYFSSIDINTKSGRNIPIARGYSKDFEAAYFSAMFKD